MATVLFPSETNLLYYEIHVLHTIYIYGLAHISYTRYPCTYYLSLLPMTLTDARAQRDHYTAIITSGNCGGIYRKCIKQIDILNKIISDLQHDNF